MGLAVESALISALEPEYNIQPGSSKWRFRPLGVPECFAERLVMPPLTKADFSAKCSGSILFVRISQQNFGDGRVGYDVASPSSDLQIFNRMNKWWQLGKHVKTWIKHPEQSPTVLAGVTGRPGAQIIIGAVPIDQSGWEKATVEGSLYYVPTRENESLDECELRGRRISKSAQIRFGAIRCHFFSILNRDGSIIGRQ